MKDWKPAGNLDLEKIEDCLPKNRRLIVCWHPTWGSAYKIVDEKADKRKQKRRTFSR